MKVEDILPLLKCPYCGNFNLTKKSSKLLLCKDCGRNYKIINGIPVFFELNNLSDHESKQKKWFEKHYSKYSKENYKLERWRLSVLKRIFSNLGSERINKYLDVGCGATGYTVIEAAKQNKLISVGIDISVEAMIRAKNFAEQQKVGDRTAFIVCSAEKLPFKDNIFDLVSAVSVLEHMENDRSVVKNINHILKKNGLFYILVPNSNKNIWPFLWPIMFYNDKVLGHKRHYSIESLKNIMDGYLLKKYFYNAHLLKIAITVLEKMILIDDKKWWKTEINDINLNSTGVQLNAYFQKNK